MKEYITVYLTIRNGKITNFDEQERDIQNALRQNNAIYIYKSNGNRKIYIGQTIHFFDRHSQHYNGNEEKFNTAHFNQVVVVFSRYFNRSALDDVESQLITYFNADNERGVEYDDDIINRTGGNSVNDYADRENIAEVILDLWNELYINGWVNTPTVEKLREKELFKYSPIKTLTDQQVELISDIINHPNTNFVINGDAGTGKTVLLTNIVARILKEKPNDRVGVVVQPNWEKTGKNIFKVFGMNSTRLVVATSSKIIASGETFDIIIVDESHKLSRRGNKQLDAFNQVYKIPAYGECKSHLEILQKIGNQIVLMYDVLQAIRPANIPRNEFARLTSSYEKKYLTTQFRIQAQTGNGYNSDDYINGIKYLLYKDTKLLDKDETNNYKTNFDPNFNRNVFRDRSLSAYFGYYDEYPLHNLASWLNRDIQLNPEHINRILSGLVEPWKIEEGTNSEKYHFVEYMNGDIIARRWNWTQDNWVHSKDEEVPYKADAEEQIGSVFAVQGIDLNKVGVLIGNDLKVVDGKLEVEPANFHNVNGTFSKEEMLDPNNLFEFKLFVLNIYYVLLTRGIDGIRLGFWKNADFQKYMEDSLDIH